MKWLDMGLKVLSVLVIPLILWGVSLQVRLAVIVEKQANMDSKLDAAHAMETAVIRLETTLNGTNKLLDEIRADARRALPSP